MTHDAEYHEWFSKRIAEKQARLYKWVAGIVILGIALLAYAGLSIFNHDLPSTITFILAGVYFFWGIKIHELRDDINSSKRRHNMELNSSIFTNKG